MSSMNNGSGSPYKQVDVQPVTSPQTTLGGTATSFNGANPNYISPMQNKAVGGSDLSPPMTMGMNGQPATLLQTLQQQGVSRSGY